ncbi:MAG: polysaccharide deacetylase, partial [Variovorax sp.]|nr:polysaccharide deacetylase [Variovorax sp.]
MPDKHIPRLAHFVWPPTPLQGATPAARQSRFRSVPRTGVASLAAGAYATLRQGRTQRAAALILIAASVISTGANAQNSCQKPVYLTFDTGHMGIAPLVADVLRRQDVRVTFFGAAERTQTEGDSLDNHWAPWWKARAAEGHEFASHTYDHVYWRGDDKSAAPRFRMQPTAGAFAGRQFTWDAATYCAEIAKASDRLAQITGKKPLPLFRAPGGKTSPKLLAAAKACGYEHVGWAPAGFLGDELPSEKFSNEKLLQQALDRIRPGDILLA